MRRCIFFLGLLVVIGCSGSPRAPAAESATTAPAAGGDLRATTRRTDAEPVGASMKVTAAKIRAGETFAVSVVLDVAAGYEIQRLHAPPPAIATLLELKLPPGFQALGEWSTPQTVRSQWPDGHSVYVGEAKFTRQVRVGKDVAPAKYELRCAIRYQACNDHYCLRPVDVKLVVAVPVQP